MIIDLVPGSTSLATLEASLSTDAVIGSTAPLNPNLHALRGHSGQIDVANAMRELLRGSEIRDSHREGDTGKEPGKRHNQRTVMSATGSDISCNSWLTEAPLRMLMNNLNPDVAEDPHELVVHGGMGRAARTWDDFDQIVASLRDLNNEAITVNG